MYIDVYWLVLRVDLSDKKMSRIATTNNDKDNFQYGVSCGHRF